MPAEVWKTVKDQVLQSDSPNPRPGALQSAPDLSVIIPAFNEAARIARSLRQLGDYAAASGRRIKAVVVDDASIDATTEVVRAFDPGPIDLRLIRLPRHRGKGAAVRAGMLTAAGEMLLMTDADFSTPIAEVERLIPHLGNGADAVIGSRQMPGSVLGAARTPTRRLMERLFRFVRRRLMLPDIRDTQCGFKLFRREAARKAFAELVCAGFAFDCEVLARIAATGGRIVEVGVAWCDAPDSRVRPVRDGLTMLADLIWIRRRVPRAARSASRRG